MDADTERETAIAHHRDCLRQMLVGWKASSGDFKVRKKQGATAQMVIAWTSQVHRFGKAFLQLEKHGLEHETHPLVRSALEYTIVGHWAAAVGENAVVARFGEDQRALKALIKDLEATPT